MVARWPDGFVCPGCGHAGGWRLGDGRWMCSDCGARTSPASGHDLRSHPDAADGVVHGVLAVCLPEGRISALSVQRSLEIGSYQTAWAMLHRLRSVLVRPGRELLHGRVEVDETFIGGEEPGLRGGRTKGKKALVAIAVERIEPRGYGRCRMSWIPDASGDSLRSFLIDSVQEGATVITDGWQGYRPATWRLYTHERIAVRDAKASDLLPGVHRIASLAQRWLLGTHKGAVDEAHLTSYLDEFVFRFNRRRSRSRGMLFYRVLELAVTHDPVRYRDLILNPRRTTTPRRAPTTRGRPSSLERPPAERPWRHSAGPSSG